ncbi:hypothetical protein [Vibrio rarus]|uniref:hypothetical protein n=1 Tax=Vibrio rarus TaxID=413403 RepID=UPI0021C3D1D7|nr:hypothetical protein [Vibrio rarus]
MAKISAQQRAANQERYDAVILDTFFNEGHLAVTLGAIAKKLGIQRSTLQSYYPNGPMAATKGKIFPVVIQKLDFTSAEELRASWVTAMSDMKFRYVMELLIATATEKKNAQASAGLKRLYDLVSDSTGASYSLTDELLGITIRMLMLDE